MDSEHYEAFIQKLNFKLEQKEKQIAELEAKVKKQDIKQSVKIMKQAVKHVRPRKPFRPFRTDIDPVVIWDNGWNSALNEVEALAEKLRKDNSNHGEQ